jgi:hypothetical protein
VTPENSPNIYTNERKYNKLNTIKGIVGAPRRKHKNYGLHALCIPKAFGSYSHNKAITGYTQIGIQNYIHLIHKA